MQNLIQYECDDFIIAFKAAGIPTVPLKKQKVSGTLLGEVSALFPEIQNVHGKNEWEGGALHRLDTDTRGLVVFARNQKFYNYLQDKQLKGKFIKEYIAITDATESVSSEKYQNPTKIESYFRAFGPGRKLVKAETDPKKSDNGVLYSTIVSQITALSVNKNYLKENSTAYLCTITNGFRHQIRVHLATSGHPIKGDRRYNPTYIQSTQNRETSPHNLNQSQHQNMETCLQNAHSPQRLSSLETHPQDVTPSPLPLQLECISVQWDDFKFTQNKLF